VRRERLAPQAAHRAYHAAVAALLFLLAFPARAQLISPGDLTAAHAHLEGLRNCTSCHQLGQRGVDPAKCLACHTPLRTRIAQRRGFHATVSRACGSCHKDHFGRSFDPVRLATGSFDHHDTGFRLVGRHLNLTCRTCHRPEYITDQAVRQFVGQAGRLSETFLGLGDDCETCHRRDNPHGQDFAGRSCASCHSPQGWDDVSNFDHAATGFPLVGAHASVACSACHGDAGRGAARFEGLSTSCRGCHADESPHGSQFRGEECSSCHGNASWGGTPNFNHARTGFPLTGAHASIACANCHPGSGPRRQFEGVEHASCNSCHEDAHDGAFGTDCATCHTTAGWQQMSSSFDADRFDHEAHTGFALVGAHGLLECGSCHSPRDDGAIVLTFTGPTRGVTFPPVAAETCLSCHRDPHDGAFLDAPGGPVCDNCHGQDAWTPTAFGIERHARTDFPLTGAHLATPCSACHTGSDGHPPDFRIPDACESCHADLNPHGEEFTDAGGVTRCAECHNTTDWDLAAFDHSQTGFPLTGAHAGTECTTCHARETLADGRVVRRFTGLSTACASCHGADDPHEGQFEDQACDACHDTQAFTIAHFDHGRTRFPLDGAHESVPCASCHRPEPAPDGTVFVRFKPLGTACADCHSGG
jgi:predicted CXXCH cytochrome family protein